MNPGLKVFQVEADITMLQRATYTVVAENEVEAGNKLSDLFDERWYKEFHGVVGSPTIQTDDVSIQYRHPTANVYGGGGKKIDNIEMVSYEITEIETDIDQESLAFTYMPYKRSL